MTASQLPLALAQRHYNRQLFADRYLDDTLPSRPAWHALVDAATPVLKQVQALMAAFVPSSNEAQTEHDLVRPVLTALGHTFEVQAALRTPKGTKKPDYLFYRDPAALTANKGRTLTDADLLAAFAIGDAKFWERKLDVSTPGDDADLSRVPADQIAFYMRHSGVTWGILTNGRRWRLYHRDTVEKQDRFYEVDLKELVEAADVGAFLYFYAFFRRAAFDPPLGEALALDAMLRESVDYARGVSESLKAQVFDALRHLVQGWLDYPRNHLTPSPEMLREIYASSLIVLYRLLFVLYAEARELLPLRESARYCTEYSLYTVVRDVAKRLDSGLSLLTDTGQTWAKLVDLFGIINLGSPPLQVATFNGGLFDSQRHSFLERFTLGDAQLQQALDKLARVVDPASGMREFIDYRDLAERHLGTIYEGLLEYHLVPLDAVERRPEDVGFSVALVNDKGERHRTGSYYTPTFVVNYIVEQTLGPVLATAVAGKTTDAERIAAVLGVNCLDPAMGSGHFPVAAMDYIARYLVDSGVVPPADAGDEPDLAYWKRRVAQSCIYGVDLNPLAVDLAKLSLWLATAAKGRPLSFLDHHLRCGNALVGARASELDGTVAAPKRPKTRKKAAAVEAGQLALLDDAAFAGAMSSAVDSMWLIEGSAARTVGEVKEQERIYETVRHGLTERFAVTADLRTAQGFGQAPEPNLWKSLVEYVTKNGNGTFTMSAYEPLLQQVRAIKAAQRFFHWDLEFPEVFYDRFGRPLGATAGFDAVIGNPPYVRQEQLGALKPYFQTAFAETYSGTADLSVYFLHQGTKLLKSAGRLSYITSGTFRKLGFGAALRNWLSENITLQEVIDFGEHQVFTDATTYPIIISLKRTLPTAGATVIVRQMKAPDAISQEKPNAYPLPTGESAWVFTNQRLRNIIEGWSGSQPLRTLLAEPIYRGVTTGLNEAFVIDQTTYDRFIKADPHCAAVLKPFLRGEDLHPWYQENEGRWLLFFPSKWTKQTFGANLDEQAAWGRLGELYPSITAHLESFAAAGRIRRDQGDFWWELRPCNYYSSFERPRIFSTKVSLYPTFSLSESLTYAVNTSYVLPLVDTDSGWYLLGLLNSRVSEWYSRNVFSSKANGYYEVQPDPLAQFPIPDAPPPERTAIGDLAMQITQAAQARYALHQRVRRRILSDLGTGDTGLNQKLTAWWALDFPAFRAELLKVFKRAIAVKERDEWEEWLLAQREQHAQHTASIVAGEVALNARVYRLFDLDATEIALIEAATKYRYGEV